MSTIRATYVQHGSSAVPNITLNASGQVIVASGLVSSGTFAAPSGTAAAPGVYFVGDADTGLYSPGANQVAIATSGTGKVFIDSNGNVGVGASSPVNFTNYKTITAQGVTTGAGGVYASQTSDASTQALYYTLSGEARLGTTTSTPFAFLTSNLERLRITSAGNVGIGLSTPTAILHTYANIGGGNPSTSGTTDANVATRFQAGSVYLDVGVQTAGHVWLQPRLSTTFSSNFNLLLCPNGGVVGIGTLTPTAAIHATRTGDSTYFRADSDSVSTLYGSASALSAGVLGTFTNHPLSFYTNSSERARIDSSGRLLVGTSSARSNFFGIGATAAFQVEGSAGNAGQLISHVYGESAALGGPYFVFGKHRSGSVGGTTLVANNDQLGAVSFTGADGTNFLEGARIQAFVDGTPGANDMPGRLVFFTTADGASSPTERMRLDSAGSMVLASGTAFVAPYVYNVTTATGANVNVDANGFLRRSTSSIKYKTNVETIQDQYADAILGCRPVWYQSTCEADKPEWGHWGFIAEEVAEIDPRLCFFKEEEDGTLEPEGVQYDRFVPHLLNLIKRQGEAIAELQAEVAALKVQ